MLRLASRKAQRRLALSVLAAGVLLAAQAFAFSHALDLDAHGPDSICAVCVTAAGIGGPGATEDAPGLSSWSNAELPSYGAVPATDTTWLRKPPRGPPALA